MPADFGTEHAHERPHCQTGYVARAVSPRLLRAFGKTRRGSCRIRGVGSDAWPATARVVQTSLRVAQRTGLLRGTGRSPPADDPFRDRLAVDGQQDRFAAA